jgi:hypothetical protein
VRYSSAIAIHWSSGDPGKGPVTRYVIEARPSGGHCRLPWGWDSTTYFLLLSCAYTCACVCPAPEKALAPLQVKLRWPHCE